MISPQVLIVVDQREDWAPFFPTDQVILVDDYLFSETFQDLKKINVINLCQDSSYLSSGYYCSLIAESRGHKSIPTIQTFNDLKNNSIYLDELDFIAMEKYQKILDKNLKDPEYELILTFGKNKNPELNNLSHKIFNIFPAPILKINFQKDNNKWRIKSVELLGLKNFPAECHDQFAETIDQYSNKIWRTKHNRKKFVADLAILIDEKEELPPSDEKAIDRFLKACRRNDVFCEIITKNDYHRINEFDGLFIRSTTSIDNFTFDFVKKAESEGLIVIDDSISILRCTNKIYMNNKMERAKIPVIPGIFVSKNNIEAIEEAIEDYGFPLICKVPDGSFSLGVKKVKNREDLELTLKEMFTKSSLILIQKYLPTDFDWRIGVLNNEPLFACKYFMSRGHWQIYNHEKDQNGNDFAGAAKTYNMMDVPPKVLKYALKASKIVGPGLYGVDLKELENGEVYVVEVNDNPNIDSGVEDKINTNFIYDKIIQYFIHRITNRRIN